MKFISFGTISAHFFSVINVSTYFDSMFTEYPCQPHVSWLILKECNFIRYTTIIRVFELTCLDLHKSHIGKGDCGFTKIEDLKVVWSLTTRFIWGNKSFSGPKAPCQQLVNKCKDIGKILWVANLDFPGLCLLSNSNLVLSLSVSQDETNGSLWKLWQFWQLRATILTKRTCNREWRGTTFAILAIFSKLVKCLRWWCYES